MNIFDTHVHYDGEAFAQDREELVSSLPLYGIGPVCDIGSSVASSRAAADLADRYPFVCAAVGVHPSETEGLTEADMETLKELYARPKVVAVGEIGLDYHWPEPGRELQKKWFVRQLQLARELSAPVVIHSRDAAQDTLDIVRSEGQGLTMDIHCFSYGKELAREYLNLGHYLGVGGVLTFKNGKKLREAVTYAPLSQILLETDCPYLSPEPLRGRRNSSLNLPYVVTALAALKDVSEEEVIRVTRENAFRFYRLREPFGDGSRP